MPESLPASLPHAFQVAARRHPGKLLLTFEGGRTSYGEMLEHVQGIAGTLVSFGLVKGERVGLYLENSPSFVSAYLGVLWAGGVIVPINTRYRQAELSHMLRDAEPHLVLSDAAGADELAAVAGSVPTLTLTGDPSRDPWRTLAPQAAPLTTPHPLGHDDLAMIVYTSGTTGKSKGAMLTHGNFLHNSAAVTAAWRWTSEDVLILALPLFHMHGLGVGLHGTVLQGSSLHLLRRFDAEAIFEAMLEPETTMFFGVPTMYSRLLEVARRRPETPALRLLVSGSAPLSPQTHREVEEVFGSRILERYGMTETVMNLGNPFDGERRPGTVGTPFPGVELRIANPATDQPVPPGAVGELQVRGPNVMKGYWRDPEATGRTFTTDGYFKTGDLGFTDEGGYTTLSGRAKDLIISGGFNVYPREVEEVIAEVAGVEEVAVLGLPDPDLGEKVVAVIVGDADTDAILAHCRARIADFKKPRTILRAATLPRNALGKVQKHLLAQELKARSW